MRSNQSVFFLVAFGRVAGVLPWIELRRRLEFERLEVRPRIPVVYCFERILVDDRLDLFEFQLELLKHLVGRAGFFRLSKQSRVLRAVGASSGHGGAL